MNIIFIYVYIINTFYFLFWMKLMNSAIILSIYINKIIEVINSSKINSNLKRNNTYIIEYLLFNLY